VLIHNVREIQKIKKYQPQIRLIKRQLIIFKSVKSVVNFDFTYRH